MDETRSRLALVAAKTGPDSDGLYSFRVDEETGDLEQLSSIPAGESPKFLAVHPDGRHCYLVDTTDGGSVAAIELDPETGARSVRNRVASGGDGPCYCSVDATGSYVFVTHYVSGNVAVLPIDADGTLGNLTAVIAHHGSGVNPDRQEAPHPHSVRPGPENRLVYVPDLGMDRVYVYEFDSDRGELRPADPPHVAVAGGSGPRHLSFSTSGEAIYVVNELNSTLTSLAHDPETGVIRPTNTVSTLPGHFHGDNKPADVHVHPSDRWVYVSNRGHDSIAVFEVEEDGALRCVGHESTRGAWPRDFAIDPTGRFLYVENQNTDEIHVFQVDDRSGELTPTGGTTTVPRPGCMVFVPPT